MTKQATGDSKLTVARSFRSYTFTSTATSLDGVNHGRFLSWTRVLLENGTLVAEPLMGFPADLVKKSRHIHNGIVVPTYANLRNGRLWWYDYDSCLKYLGTSYAFDLYDLDKAQTVLQPIREGIAVDRATKNVYVAWPDYSLRDSSWCPANPIWFTYNNSRSTLEPLHDYVAASSQRNSPSNRCDARLAQKSSAGGGRGHQARPCGDQTLRSR